MNGYNFTERVRTVLAYARDEATALKHEYVGTEHLLLGLIREGTGVVVAGYLVFGVTAAACFLITKRDPHRWSRRLSAWHQPRYSAVGFNPESASILVSD